MKKILFVLAVLLFPHISQAHVAYVVGIDEMRSVGGFDAPYLLAPFFHLPYIGIMIGTIFLVLIGYLILNKTILGKRLSLHMKGVFDSYHEFIPWIIRLSLGIALIGAGTAGVLISPIIENTTFHTLQILLGFFLMAGFLLVPTIFCILGLYLFGLSLDIYLIGNLDFFALALGLLVFHSARPGVDDVLGISLLHKIHIPRIYLAPLLRVGIGGAMIFLALYEKIFNPHFMELVINQYHLTQILPVNAPMWVFSTGAIELAIGIFLVLGLYTRVISIIAIIVISLSFFYFNESVYSHITLFGTLSILAIENGGLFSLDRWRQKKNSHQSFDAS